MRILVLSKRQYTNLDLINDRFGRLRELPLALAATGQEVKGICLSYRLRDEGRYPDIQGDARVDWHTLNLQRLLPWGSKTYWATLQTIGRDFRPDLVWACSDMFHAVLAVPIARKFEAALVVDLYDNFESFPAAHLPGLKAAFYRALKQADGITCVSQPLARYVRRKSGCRCPIETIENAVPTGFFRPLDRLGCRRELKLPEDGLLIGTAGSLSRSRDIDILFQAFEKLRRERKDLHLVLAGKPDKSLKFSQSAYVHYLGVLPQVSIPAFLSALDISVICNRASAFGRYCFPQKFYESVACGVPVVAAATGVMKELLKTEPENLFIPGSVDSLVSVLRSQIEQPHALLMDAPTWTMMGKRLERFFQNRCKFSSRKSNQCRYK